MRYLAMHRLPRWLRATAVALSVLLVASVLSYPWALTSTDRSGLARAIAWQDADTDDWQRFPDATDRRRKRAICVQTGVWPYWKRCLCRRTRAQPSAT